MSFLKSRARRNRLTRRSGWSGSAANGGMGHQLASYCATSIQPCRGRRRMNLKSCNSSLTVAVRPFFALAMALLMANLLVAAEKKNVLYIVADDLNCNLGCYSHTMVKSPNIDRLAARGVRFDRAYCNYPVCNASRTSFLSGRRPDSTGIVDNVTPPRTFLKDAVMLPEHFRRSGYTTIKVGKIFHTGKQFEDPRSWDLDIVERSTAKKPPEEQILRRQGKSGIVL